MAKCSDHFTKFKVVYPILTKDKALTTLVRFVQDFVMPLGTSPPNLRANGGGEFIADYYHDYCKTTAISERDGCTIMGVARCIPNEAALSKSLWGKIVATVVLLLNRPSSKAIGGDTSSYRMLTNMLICSFCELLEPVYIGAVKRTLR